MEKHVQKKIIVVIFAFIVMSISVASFFIDSDAFIAMIGINNAYLILFTVSATAGVSILTAAGFYTFFVSFIQLQVDPVIAAVIAGIGLSVGDMIIFTLARLVKRSSRRIEMLEMYQKICHFIEKLPTWSVYLFVFLYGAIIPIPNDILMAALGALRYKTVPIIIAIAAGNIILMLLITKGVISVL